jgi:hypothetical protein
LKLKNVSLSKRTKFLKFNSPILKSVILILILILILLNDSCFIYSKDENGHIFFDRNPRVFEVILDFYRTGKLIRSPDIPLELLKEELDFFQLNIAEDSDHKRLSMELMKLEYRSD